MLTLIKSMKRNNIIIIGYGSIIEAWGSLTELCQVHDLPYHTLKLKKFPFNYEGIYFKKIPYRTKLT